MTLMINPHSIGVVVAISAGLFGALIGCAVAIFAARMPSRVIAPRSKRTPRV